MWVCSICIYTYIHVYIYCIINYKYKDILVLLAHLSFKNIKIIVLKSCIKAPGRVLSSGSNGILGKQQTEDPAQCFRRGETVTVSVSLWQKAKAKTMPVLRHHLQRNHLRTQPPLLADIVNRLQV